MITFSISVTSMIIGLITGLIIGVLGVCMTDRRNRKKEKSRMKFGKWKELSGNFMTPGGTPIYVCAECGGSEHLYGVEFPEKKIVCDDCGSINSYPWERIREGN